LLEKAHSLTHRVSECAFFRIKRGQSLRILW
jgi:hypothetical protein